MAELPNRKKACTIWVAQTTAIGISAAPDIENQIQEAEGRVDSAQRCLPGEWLKKDSATSSNPGQSLRTAADSDRKLHEKYKTRIEEETEL
jgi:hypothetical protein